MHYVNACRMWDCFLWFTYINKQGARTIFFMQIHSVRSGADEPTQFHGFMKFKMERLVFAGGDAFFTLNQAVLSPTSLDP